MEDQPIPKSDESEAAILCCLLNNPGIIDEAKGKIQPEHLFNPGHSCILEALYALHSAQAGVDAITLAGALHKARKLEACGGHAYLMGLQMVVPTAAFFDSYVELVVDAYHRRAIQTALLKTYKATTGESGLLLENITLLKKAIQDWQDQASPVDEVNNHAWLEAIEDIEQKYEDWRSGGMSKVRGIPTGIAGMDRLDGGLIMKAFTIIAARPSQGKTRLLTQILLSAAIHKAKSLFFSMEQNRAEIAQSILCQSQSLDVDGAFKGALKEKDLPKVMANVGIFRDLIYIDDTPSLTVLQIKAKAKRFLAQHPDTKIIAIDHHMLIKPARRANSDNDEKLLSEISIGISEMKKELGVHVILLCQINREGSRGRPRMSHIKGSGQFEADADNIWIIDMEDNAEVSIREGWLRKDKGRNSPTGDVKVDFIKNHLLFREAN